MTKARPGTGLWARPNMRDYHVRAPLGSGFYFDSVNGGGGSTIPTDFPGLQWWFDESQETTFANDDPMSIEHDWSGNGLHNTSGTTFRPLFKINQINGLPAVDFDGTNDMLTPPSKSAINFLHEGDFTLVMVIKSDTDNVTKTIFDSVASINGARGIYIELENTAQIRTMIGNGTGNVVLALTPLNSFSKDVYHLVVMRYDQNGGANAFTVEIDNVLVLASAKLANNAVGDAAAAFVRWGGHTGGLQAFNGQMAERFAYNRLLTDDELNSLIGGSAYL